jgi:hypothetical protein
MNDSLNLRRPRFSLRTLAIFVALVALSTWWVTWPKRTAVTFVRVLSERKFQEILELMTARDRAFLERLDFGDLTTLKVTPTSRSWWDVVAGRQSFELGKNVGYHVQRGRVSFFPFSK